jgi:hypothetical protein
MFAPAAQGSLVCRTASGPIDNPLKRRTPEGIQSGWKMTGAILIGRNDRPRVSI